MTILETLLQKLHGNNKGFAKESSGLISVVTQGQVYKDKCTHKSVICHR